MSVTLKIKKLDKDLPTPQYAHPGDAAFDLYAREETKVEAGEYKLIPTGLALEIPEGFVGLVWDKSGVAGKNGLKTLGGVIDAGYRGEVMVGLANLSKKDYTFEKGHKVAQMIIQKREEVEIVEVDELDDSSSRADGGFGSTGK